MAKPSDRPSTSAQRTTVKGPPWLLRVGLHCLMLLGTFVAGLVLVGLAQRVGWLSSAGSDPHVAPAAVLASTDYTCSMHPEIRQDGPGKCPLCGMDLVHVPRTAKSQPTAMPSSPDVYSERSVSIDSYARRILGIRTAQAKSEEVFRTIRTIGKIKFDEQRVATIAAYVDGRLEKLFAQYVGVKVAKGDDLAVLYSPQLYSAQVEYLSSRDMPALDALGGGGQRLSEVALDNLKELGMSESQIAQLHLTQQAQKRLRITSPIGGMVIAKHKVEGDYVKTGEPIYRVADLSTVWLMLELYPSDATAVRFGQQVEAQIQSLPGEVYTGRVVFVDSMVNKKSQTVAVRVEMINLDKRLKPGDYATAAERRPALRRVVARLPSQHQRRLRAKPTSIAPPKASKIILPGSGTTPSAARNCTCKP